MMDNWTKLQARLEHIKTGIALILIGQIFNIIALLTIIALIDWKE